MVWLTILLLSSSLVYYTDSFVSVRLNQRQTATSAKEGSLSPEEEAYSDATILSKSQWKRKKFLLINDIQDCIERHQHEKAISKAELFIERQQRMAEHDTSFAPSISSYNLLLNAIAKSKRRSKGAEAEELLRWLQRNGPAPNAVSYTTCMNAYALSKHRTSAKQTQRILEELLEASERDSSLEVTSVTMDVALHAWAAQGTYQSAQSATNMLSQWQAASQAQKLKMVAPTSHSFATVLSAWAQLKSPDAAEQAQVVFDSFESKDDTIVQNALLSAWSRSNHPEAAEKCQEILNTIKDPNVISYNTVLSIQETAMEKERFLQNWRNKAEVDESIPPPTRVSYNTVIHAWSSEGNLTRAQQVLEFLKRHEKLKPDAYSFTSILDGWAKSKLPQKAQNAQKFLHTMPREVLRTNIVPYNTVLNACAFSAEAPKSEQRQALQIAVQLYKRLHQDGESLPQPDAITYGNMLKCIGYLVPPKMKSEMAGPIFVTARQNGLVNEFVWKQAVHLVPGDLKAMSSAKKPLTELQVRDLPREWTWANEESIKGEARPARKKQPARRRSTASEQSYQSGRDL